MTSTLQNVTRCPAPLAGSECRSAVFYDWGLEVMTETPVNSVRGGHVERWNEWASGARVKICARCSTPYVIEAGQLVSIADELGPEEVQGIIARGQASLPHPKIKDP